MSGSASTPSRRVAFPVLGALVALLCLEGGSRLIEALADWRGRSEVSEQFVTSRNAARVFRPGPGDRYERTEHHWIPTDQSFATRKAPDGFRAFVLGGSAAMGWPHRGEQSIAGLLGQKVRRLLPGQPVEVINAAGNTYASFRIKVVLEEIVAYEPDVVVLYAGNNEFLENLVYHPLAGATTLEGGWGRLATARLVHRAARRILVRPVEIDVANYGGRDMQVNRLSFAFGRASRLRSDPAQFRAVREGYRANMASMIRTCRSRGVTAVVVRVPVNLKDWVPNVSVHGADVTPERLAAWQAAFREGCVALERGDASSAVPSLTRAASLDGQHAETRYRLGRALLGVGRRVEARAAFESALHLDAYPFRCIFDDVLKEVCRQEGAPMVDAIQAMEALTDDGILGFDALVDYVHPTVRSNEEIAQSILGTLMDLGGVPRGDPAAFRLPVSPDVEDDPLVLRALYRQFMVMRQYDSLPDLADRLRRSLERAVAAGIHAKKNGRVLADLDATQAVLEPYARLLRAEKLGILESEIRPEEAERVFAAYTELVRRLEGGDLSDEEFRNFVPAMGDGR